MAVGDANVFPGFLTPVLTQLFFPKPPTTFLTCFCRGERRKYAGKKSRLNRGWNSQPPGHESETLTTSGRYAKRNHSHFSRFHGDSFESEIVRVISLSTMEITDITGLKKKNLQGPDTVEGFDLQITRAMPNNFLGLMVCFRAKAIYRGRSDH